jgi:para-nitrobenzyl esterase
MMMMMMNKQLKRAARTLSMLAVAGISIPPAAAGAQGTPQIKVVVADGGPVKGMITDYGRAFLGIPYAAPPVGELRWKAPQPVQPWGALLDATQLESSCPQNPGPFGLASTDEDCLYLNIYTPPVSTPVPEQSLPVMVWLHPGAFQVGDSGAQIPSELVGRGVVVVTLNYRLGVLGWLAHGALTAESPDATSGNYGLQDQQAALQWVQNNIAAFGGDPSNVTIFGESAGGVSVHAHMVSEQSAGLFHRGIVQSGAYTLAFSTLADAEAQGAAFASQVGCATGDLACLRAVPVSAVLAAQNPLPSAYVPRVDGFVLERNAIQAFSTGQFNHVPVIEGSTHDEFSLFVATTFFFRNPPLPPLTYPQKIAVLLGLPQVLGPVIAAQYPLASYGNSEFAALTAIGTDAAFACNSLLAMSLLAPQVAVYGYEFDDPDAPMGALPQVPGFDYGAYHGSELQYLFDVRRTVPAPDLDANQEQLSDAMQSYWTEFAATGDPNSAGTPTWQQFRPTAGLFNLQLLTPPTPVPYLFTSFAADHKCQFWASLSGG